MRLVARGVRPLFGPSKVKLHTALLLALVSGLFTFALPYAVLFYLGLEAVPWAYPIQYWGILGTVYILGYILSYFVIWRGRSET